MLRRFAIGRSDSRGNEPPIRVNQRRSLTSAAYIQGRSLLRQVPRRSPTHLSAPKAIAEYQGALIRTNAPIQRRPMVMMRQG